MSECLANEARGRNKGEGKGVEMHLVISISEMEQWVYLNNKESKAVGLFLAEKVSSEGGQAVYIVIYEDIPPQQHPRQSPYPKSRAAVVGMHFPTQYLQSNPTFV